MLNEFFESFTKNIITQFKIPRKGIAIMLFLLSTFTIIINKWFFHYSIAPKGSLFLQFIYFIWLYSIFAIFAKAYNEYCDEKDAKKEYEQKQAEKIEARKQNILKYFEMFDYCSHYEQQILVKFYYHQSTSIYVDDTEIIKAMRTQGLTFLSYQVGLNSKALTSTYGLKLINKYFDREKPKFFKLLNRLEEKEVKLLKDFTENDDEQISLYKKEIKTAKSIISKFSNTKFDDFYIDTDGYFTTSTLCLAYLHQYFDE